MLTRAGKRLVAARHRLAGHRTGHVDLALDATARHLLAVAGDHRLVPVIVVDAIGGKPVRRRVVLTEA